ncbi:hypothetical protein [Gordonia sp. GAMMA]|uniref:hypothetical protein n=1 Tax=Gordonia sp. GAMMA TaxID=2502241 RepID=UPI0010F4E56B|nr:hypothetical protein [Gordonia sp. GAMMA]
MKDAGNVGGLPNRRARRAAGQRGAHRAAPSTAPSKTALGVIGLGTALAVMAGVGGVAAADPEFNPLPPSASNPTPNTSNPTPPSADVGPGAIIDPPSESGWRSNPWSDNAPDYAPIQNWTPAAPTFIGPIQLPPPPPMIMPEPGMIRVGKYQEVKPPWMTMAEMNSINRWSAYIESRVAQYWLSQGFSQEEADRRAASMTVGGLVGGAAGGAAGFAIGVVPGAVVGGGVGALAGTAIGAGIAATLGLPLNSLFPVGGTGLYGSFVGVGAVAGAGAGAVGGALAGGLIGGVLVGVPAAAIGVGLGSLFGGGDPNAEIDQPWTYRDGQGLITPKDNVLEFDWNGPKSNKLPGGWELPEEAHVNFQVKDDKTYVVKLGEERWLGATEQQRDKHFYGEMNTAVPGLGDAAKGFLEDEDGQFQNTIRGLLGQIAREDPDNAQFNPRGDIADPSARAERVPYPTSSTPDPWDEPNREGVERQNEENRGTDLPGMTTTPETGPAPTPVAQPTVAPSVAPQQMAVVPQPIQAAVDAAPEPVRKAVSDAQSALGQLIPGMLGA